MHYGLKSLGSGNSLQEAWHPFCFLKGDAGVKLDTSLGGGSGRYQAVLSELGCSIALRPAHEGNSAAKQ